MRIPAEPGLYDVSGEPPLLTGTRCSHCAQVSFPPLTIGCDRCGVGEEFLELVQLEATGLVHSIATVHFHHGEPAAPFAVAEVALDSGPLIRALVAGDAHELAIGDRASAVWVVTGVDDTGNETVEPRFAGVLA
jgi:uncharacterized OB-fold protein